MAEPTSLTYLGRKCPKCGGTERYRSNAHCRKCHSKSDRKIYGARRAEQDARRRLKKLCPMALNDAEAVLDKYKEAQFLTLVTGIKHHVDHIVPLNHPDVCGLHVSWNLEVIPASDNIRKSNSFDPTDRRIYPEFCGSPEISILSRFSGHDHLTMVGKEHHAEKETVFAH